MDCIKRKGDKIGTQACYDIYRRTHNVTLIYHNMSVSQSRLCSFLCNPYISFQISYLLVLYCACTLSAEKWFSMMGVLDLCNGAVSKKTPQNVACSVRYTIFKDKQTL